MDSCFGLIVLFEEKTNYLWHISLLSKHIGSDSMSTEEEEVRKMIRECLDLRKSYVYREIVEPWMVEAVGESSASEMNSDPFHFKPTEATAVSYSSLVHGLKFSKDFFCFVLKLTTYQHSNTAIHLFVNLLSDIAFWFSKQHHFKMEDGVVHVYASENGKYHNVVQSAVKVTILC